MKALKKITAFAVAMTMGCSIAAFAACNPDGIGDGEEGELTNPPAQLIDAALASALKQEKQYANLNFVGKMSYVSTHYTKNGSVFDVSYADTHNMDISATGKIDVKNGNGDFVARSSATNTSTGADRNTEISGRNDSTLYYYFLRDWNDFLYESLDRQEVTDFTGKELSYGSSMKIDWEEILGQLGLIGGSSDAGSYASEASSPMLPDLSTLPQTGDLACLALPEVNLTLINLAAAANTLNNENGVYSIDLIKTVQTVITEVGSVVSSLKDETTVGDILNNATVKKYFSVITELIPVETVKTTVSTVIDGLAANEDIKPMLLYIQQDLNAIKTITASTTYDYIISLVGSQNLVNIINTVITLTQGQGAAAGEVASGTFLTKTLDKYTVSEILALVNAIVQTNDMPPITLDVVKNAYELYVKPVCDGETITIDNTINMNSAITELSLEYKVENGKLASQKVNFAFEQTFTTDIGEAYPGHIPVEEWDESAIIYYYDKSENKWEGTLEVTYESSAPALVDISSNPVSYYEYEWVEEYLCIFEVPVFDCEQAEYVRCYVGAHVVDGEYAGFKLFYDENQNREIGEGTDSVEFQLGNTSYRIYECGRTMGDRISIDFYVEAINYGIVATASVSQGEVRRTATVSELLKTR